MRKIKNIPEFDRPRENRKNRYFSFKTEEMLKGDVS